MKQRESFDIYYRQPRTVRVGLRRSCEGYNSGTGRESQYLDALTKDNCELVFVFCQGGEVTGRLAWYDQNCLKVAPSDGSPSLLIPKESLKYLYELGEDETS